MPRIMGQLLKDSATPFMRALWPRLLHYSSPHGVYAFGSELMLASVNSGSGLGKVESSVEAFGREVLPLGSLAVRGYLYTRKAFSDWWVFPPRTAKRQNFSAARVLIIEHHSTKRSEEQQFAGRDQDLWCQDMQVDESLSNYRILALAMIDRPI